MGMVFSFFCSRIYLHEAIFYPKASLLKNSPEYSLYSSNGDTPSLKDKYNFVPLPLEVSADSSSICSIDSFDDVYADEAQEITFDQNFNEYINNKFFLNKM